MKKYFITALLFCLLLFSAKSFGDDASLQKRRVQIPKPVLFLYGYSDVILKDPQYEYNLRPALLESLDFFNIIEGTTENADLVKALKQNNKIFAYHVWNPIRQPQYENITVDEVVKIWAAPFETTLGGKLPGGFDAIAIDEFGVSIEKPELENKQIMALKKLRERYPDRLILVASPTSLAQIGAKGHNYYKRKFPNAEPRKELLSAIAKYSDIYLHEWYPQTKSKTSWEMGKTAAANLNAVCPEILAKTVNVLSLAQNYENSPDIGFCNFLDFVMNEIKNDKYWQDTGIGFWVFYRAKPDIVSQFIRLSKHYYILKNKNLFRDGNFANRLQESSFEGDLKAWKIQPGSDASVGRALYSEIKIPDSHYASLISNGKYCLQMKKDNSGKTNSISQSVEVEPNTTYRLSAYIYSGLDSTVGKVKGELKVSGHHFFKELTTPSVTSPVFMLSEKAQWRELSMNFTTLAGVNKVEITLNDFSRPGETIYWDCVILEPISPTVKK